MNVAVFGGFGKAPLTGLEVPDRAGALRWRRPRPDREPARRRRAPHGDRRLRRHRRAGAQAGTSVALSGLSLLGGRDVKVPPGDGPVLRVRAFAILGGVTVKAAEAEPAGPESHRRRATAKVFTKE